MATDAIKGIGTINVNGHDMCIKTWKAKESGTKVSTSSSCDGLGQSSITTEKMLTITGTAFYSSSRPHHSASNHNINVDAVVDVEAIVGPSADNRKYTMSSAKVQEWEVTSEKAGVVMVDFTIESQGTGYTVPTA